MGKAASLDMVKLCAQAVTTTFNGAGHALDQIKEDFGIQYSWAVTGAGADKAITALVFDIQGSLDGSGWVTLATETADATELSNKLGLFFVTSKPVAYIRIAVTTLTISGSTGTVTLTVKAAAY